METIDDFRDIIADLIRQSFPDLDSSFAAESEALRRTPCIEPVIGWCFAQVTVEYLLAAFAMIDQDFAEEFPRLPWVSRIKRQQVLGVLENHLRKCHHCSTRHDHEVEFSHQVERSFRANRNFLRDLLDEGETTEEEGEHKYILNKEATVF